MIVSLLMLICALMLSGIAGFYSVIGMTAIFSASFIPVLLMTGGLESAKVITASWLYNNWSKTPILLRTYLTGAVVVLMFITSLGIFGFLSKAHIEQTAAGDQQQAQIQRIDQELASQRQAIDSANQRIKDVSSGGQSGDVALKARIEQATRIIDSANERVKPQLDEQQALIDQENQKIDARVKTIETQIADVDQQVAALDAIVKGLVDQQRSVLAQKKRQEQAKDREDLDKKKAELVRQIDKIRTAPNPAIDAAKARMAEIRAKVEEEVKQASAVVNELSGQLGKNVDTEKLQKTIDEQNARIRDANARIDELSAKKFEIETAYRKLEVEVGPIKYIAQFIYGDDVGPNLLERAVRWVIILIIAVFDPLAVLMLIAANQGLNEWRGKLAERWAQRRAKREKQKEAEADAVAPVAATPAPVQVDQPTEPSPDVQRLIDSQANTERMLSGLSGLVASMAARLAEMPKNDVQPAVSIMGDKPSDTMPSDQPETARDGDEHTISIAPPAIEPQVDHQEPQADFDDPEQAREPVREDVIDDPTVLVAVVPEPVKPDRIEWQIIDQLPDPIAEPEIETEQAVEPAQISQNDPSLPATTDELFDAMKDRRDQTLRNHADA